MEDGASTTGTGARTLSLTVSASAPEPGLYLVATPIGAARDITLRALDVLNTADMLAAEDTRNLRHLMDIHGIPVRGRRIVAYHDHNADRQRPAILAALGEGRSVAYASDAGTPLVADPGYRLARDAAEAGFAVRALPGPSAALAALSVSGLPSDRFLFVGFPPAAAGARRTWIESWRKVDATVIAFESPRRVKQLLENLCELEANRLTVICRELTKKFEEVLRGTATELLEQIPGEGLRGEIVVLFGRPEPAAADEGSLREALSELLDGSPVKEAAAEVAARFGRPRREIYALALEMKKERE
ncbi:16S rRNA (cytidine(1402)-2'-O)-methyltransferase [Paracoccus denitrificans]|jgi:16S rRNA (cytidine1402-2'-O)-methyltransferase|uniref:Ribosomal RNA small subunit methyltransferase I n=1 Tax=Paracoccus denitrificans (strain Pd 1222) TaxID=318586 RepID=A1B930_PARDP|nr:16S rRNA (cytidine(1402)-2'-O)-methyltransferase [Paracoccus denitrificans]ABL72024.1 Uroporphyrin-III C/tetrapyrrole (Corrin/Porphyrin) methyltransferase [Paracoccus denitrificans PD1222]MBB4626069.1 16S rRNA (cytidine1402-2'-O)-methyltransferase [Paracoccus denitrificans]MCU7426771.1 16S rRNA (cytidine(1402)-2'-O)-methyltransferase [Paracoccus denitrificans]QAR28602.1 16S rRNA (cytidine(1402)-2'-O)-methyltransferase [Paracoccus denitrificans]UPV96747.1 16S rRNA (cytidine(1402)-2'-O)-methy